MAWEEPPWTPLSGPSVMSSIDVSQLPKGEEVEMIFGAGDVPDYFYNCKIPDAAAEYFVIPMITETELRESLGSDPCVQGTGEGDHVGVATPLMGWTWSVFFARIRLASDAEAARDGVVGS